jgi:NAD(P)H-hydrate epimerase
MESKENLIPYINAETSANVDKELMGAYNYSIDQLMEIAGLTVAKVVNQEFIKSTKNCKILTLCGPGNNGGDGLVASRYLKEFGNEVDILYPKKNTKNALYTRLITQCENYEIKISEKIYDNKEDYEKIFKNYDIIVDALFGFSFKGEIRQPFKTIIEAMKKFENKIISVDIPSGFDIDKGNIFDTFIPKGLISLTLPKLCSKTFKGEHFLGGRFVPKKLFEKFNIKGDNLYKNCSELYIKI